MDGSTISARHYNIMLAALPALLAGIFTFGPTAVGVVSISIASAICWEMIMNKIMKQPVTVGDGHAALMGLLFGMILPAATPWWAVITGTFVAIVIGKQIYGGIGANAFHPVAVAAAILMLSWGDLFDINSALVDYDFKFAAAYPLTMAKKFRSGRNREFKPVGLICRPSAWRHWRHLWSGIDHRRPVSDFERDYPLGKFPSLLLPVFI
jgi:electron transport complex protein RnfD